MLLNSETMMTDDLQRKMLEIVVVGNTIIIFTCIYNLYNMVSKWQISWSVFKNKDEGQGASEVSQVIYSD